MRCLTFVFIILFQLQVHAIIYGLDNRFEVIMDARKNRDLAPAIAMSVGQVYLQTQKNSDVFGLDFLLASDSLTVGLCPEERFSRQYANWIGCTGFLVSEDVMVTAGHCMIFNHSDFKPAVLENGMTSMCLDFDWVFDFKANGSGQASIKGYNSSQTAKCEKVLYAEISPSEISKDGKIIGEYGTDLAIIKLDRPFPQRKVLKFAKESPPLNQKVFNISYPSGLPMKVANNASVLENHFQNFFTADLDISNYSSGSPVFNLNNEVVGIVARASPGEDYIWDEKRECTRSFVCKEIGKGDCSLEKIPEAYPLGVHVQKLEPIVKKLRELKIIE